MGRGWKPVRKTELLPSIRIPDNGDLGKKRLGKTEKFYKKYYKKVSSPKTEGYDWRLKMFMKCSTHSGLSLKHSRWQGKQRFLWTPRGWGGKSQRKGQESERHSLSQQQPRNQRQWRNSLKNLGETPFNLGLYPSKPSIRCLLKSVSEQGLSWLPYPLF